MITSFPHRVFVELLYPCLMCMQNSYCIGACPTYNPTHAPRKLRRRSSTQALQTLQHAWPHTLPHVLLLPPPAIPIQRSNTPMARRSNHRGLDEKARPMASVFMPEHVHLLIHPTQREYDISRILHAIKSPVQLNARSYLSSCRDLLSVRVNTEEALLSLRFWQAGNGHSMHIYSAVQLWHENRRLRSLENNPVKRTLVTRAVDWKYPKQSAKLRTGP